MQYRAEIDGLRAVAVIPVILFHAGFEVFSGGFVGVDIFFVISGYLITTIILLEKEAGTFSLVRFYERRARRILPALFLVVIACIPFGWLLLLPNDMKDFSQSIIGVSTFSSNILFWRESGYFDTSAELKPLLHTWSLAVEEQYYVFFPLFIMAFWRLGRAFILGVLGILAALSLMLAHWGHATHPEATFYLLPARGWELLIGVFASFYLLRRPSADGNQILSALGAGMVLYAIFAFDEHTPFPSAYTLVPTVGVALIILFARPSTLVGWVLCRPACVGIGLVSYSAYLWHQPLFAFTRHYLIGDIPSALAYVLILCTFGLAFLTWKFVENPFRRKATVSSFNILLFSVFGTFFFLLVGFAGHFKDGFPARFYYNDEARAYIEYFENSPPKEAYFERENIQKKYRYECDFYGMRGHFGGAEKDLPLDAIDTSCFMRNSRDAFSVFVWGDSHAQMLSYGLAQNMPQDWQRLQIASSGCPPRLQWDKDTSTYCVYSNWFALDAIKKSQPNVVIVGQDSGHNAAYMETLAEALLQLGVEKVIFTGPSPHWRYDLPKIVLRKFWDRTPQRTFVGLESDVLAADKALRADFAQSKAVRFVSIIETMCTQEGCLVFTGGDRKTGVTSWDYGHLTPIASDYFSKEILVDEVIEPRE